MANNRMILLCNVCQPSDEEWKYHAKGVLVMAKWYPVGAYYSNRSAEKLGNDFLDFLEEHAHQELASDNYLAGAGQDNPVRLVYESKSLPVFPKDRDKER